MKLQSHKRVIFILLLMGTLAIGALGLVWLRKAETEPTGISTSLKQPVELESLLIPDQKLFHVDEANRKALAFLANRWGVSEEHIYMIVQDSEPWMQIVGLLDIDRKLATQFYSTKTLGGLAIIEGIQVTDLSSRTGTILAYQSQKYLPTITIPIKDGVLLKHQAHQTPLIHD